MSKYNITEKTLKELYIEKNMKRDIVAKFFGCSDSLIKTYIKKFNLQKPKDLENKNKQKRVLKPCLNCGEDFEIPRFRKEGKWEIKFCSHSCSSKYRFLGEEHKRKVRNSVAANRRAKIKNASIDLTTEEKKSIMKIYLNCPEGYEVDHIKPISKGGKHHPDNLQYLTISENRKKGSKHEER